MLQKLEAPMRESKWLRRFILNFSLILFLLLQSFLFLVNPAYASTEKFTNTDFETNLTGWTQGDANWWLSGGVSSSNAIAVYQPLYASSYANSKVNLANPGTYDATEVVTAPTWNASTGWSFNGVDVTGTYINTGVTVGNNQDWAAVIRVSDVTAGNSGGVFFDAIDQGWVGDFGVWLSGLNQLNGYYGNWDGRINSPFSGGDHVLAISGRNFYEDGGLLSSVLAPSTHLPFEQMMLGGVLWQGNFWNATKFTTPAFSLYNTTLSPSQVSAITTAMNNFIGNSAYRNTSTKHAGTASSKVTATTDFNFFQSVNVGDTSTYNLVAYAYTDGLAVTSSDASLYANGSTITTTYTAVESGWYKLSGTITGADEPRNYGVQVKAGKTVYIDDLSLSLPTSATTSTSAPSCNDKEPNGVPDLFEIRTNKTTARLFFTPPIPPYSSFYVAYSTKPDSIQYGVEYNQSYAGNGGVLNYTINMLQPNTKYYFIIRAGNGCSTGSWGDTLTAVTTTGTLLRTYYKYFPIVINNLLPRK